MKLDKIKFARLIAYLQIKSKFLLEIDDIIDIDNFIDINVEPVQIPSMCNPETLHVLMSLMHEGNSKIEAIRQHRMMTGYGLKESKDIVEKYWVPH